MISGMIRTHGLAILILLATQACASPRTDLGQGGSLLFEAAVALPSAVTASLPAGTDPDGPWRMVRAGKGREIPVQVTGSEVAWIAHPDERQYRLERAAPKRFPVVKVLRKDGDLAISVDGSEVLRYQEEVTKAPPGIGAVYDRGGYIHPLRTPDGRAVTNHFPGNHAHHYGVWFTWTSSHIDGRRVNFWEAKKKQGRVEHVATDQIVTGSVWSGFRSRHRFVDLMAPGGRKVQLEETWDVRVYAVEDRFHVDFVSTQTRPDKTPFVIREYRYGGFGFRGSADWEGKDVDFLTSEGKTRKAGHATRPRWVIMHGKVDGREAAVLHLGHPSNFRFPQPVRINPKEPFFCWAPSQAGDFEIAAGQPYVSRYRMVISDGPITAQQAEAHWRAYAESPRLDR